MRRFRRIGVAAGAAVLWMLVAAPSAFAAGTPAGTSVSNTATVLYDVQGVTQTAIESSLTGNNTPGSGSPTVFTVDRKIDILVTEVGDSFTLVQPGENDQVLTFEVTNEGNEIQDLLLSASDGSGNSITLGGTPRTDSFDATAASPPAIWVDDGDLVFDDTLDTEVAYLDDFPVDTPIRVFVVRDIPSTEADGAASLITLDAQAVANTGNAGTPGAALSEDTGANTLVDLPGQAQIVFADDDGSLTGGTDGLRDGRHSATDGYSVESARLSIRKVATVVSDPFGNANPKSIPGSIVEYEIHIENDATATTTASGIAISDDLTTEMSGATPRLALVLDGYGAPGSGDDIQLETDMGPPVAPVISTLTAAADTDDGEFVSFVLSVDNLVLAPGEFATVRFRVQIQ